MGNSNSDIKNKDDDKDRENEIAMLKQKNEFINKLFMELSCNSHDMYEHIYLNKNYIRTYIHCLGNIVEKDTVVSYSDKQQNFYGEIIIICYDKDVTLMDSDALQDKYQFYIRIKIHQNCIHDVINKQFTVMCHDPTKQYKIKLLSLNKLRKNQIEHIYLDDDEKKLYNGTISVTLFTNLTNIIGIEPSRERIISMINSTLTNNFYEKNESSAKLIHEILNSKNSQLHDFIMNCQTDDKKNDTPITVAQIVDE